MPVTSLQCPNCGGELTDECRGTSSLNGVHPDYLCPHCEQVLAWIKPSRPLQRWLLLLSFLWIFSNYALLAWEIWNGATPDVESLIKILVPFFLMALLSFVTRPRGPWSLIVKYDPREKIWEWEAAELKLRSRPGSKW